MSLICCQEPFFLGCFAHCMPLTTGFFTPQCGTHVIKWQTAAGNYTGTLFLNKEEQIILAQDKLERGIMRFEIYLPDGAKYVHVTDDLHAYNCFTAEIYIERTKPIPPTGDSYYTCYGYDNSTLPNDL